MKQYFSILAALLLCFNASILKAQNVNIPNATFKGYLVTSAVNTNGDFEIQLSEAQSFTGSINVNGLLISDLTGLEEFTNLTGLHCFASFLPSLDVSANVMLLELDCGGNLFSSLDLSNNVNLTKLACSSSKITQLDLSNNVNLTELDCQRDTFLTAINIKNGNNTSITSFAINDNPALVCVEVDDVNYSTTNWTNIDAGLAYSTSCFVSITKTEALPNLQVYPNPTPNALTIDLGTAYSTVNITVSNTIGQKIQSFNATNTQRLDLNIEGLSGWYFVQIETEKGSKTIKVLKQ